MTNVDVTTIEVTNVEVLMVRVYLTEAETHLESLLKRLNDEGKVRGVTVFRGIAGFGKSGEIHSSSLLDMSLNLPVVVEFFDDPDKAQVIIDELYKQVGSGHITSWLAQLSVD